MNTTFTESHYHEHSHQLDAARLGIWAFISSEILFFAPLFLSYIVVRTTFHAGVIAASQHTNFIAGTFNTAVLLTSSLMMALANLATQNHAAHEAVRWLRASAALGAMFLAVKFYEYYHDWHAHLIPGANFQFDVTHKHAAELFFYLYFCMTGLHALHLLIGIIIVLVIAQRATYNMPKHEHAVEITALYWHFVDAVWVFLYPLFYLVQRHG